MNTFKKCALALCVMGLAQVASASTLDLTLTDSSGHVIDSFTLDPNSGQADGVGPAYVFYSISGDLLGFNSVYFGDTTVAGGFGIGNTNGSNIVNQQIAENFSSPLYSGSGLVADLAAGASYTATSGDILSVAAAVPEPSSLALMLAAIGVMGVVARRRA